MGFFDRFRNDAGTQSSSSADEQAIARYRYLLRTAPPEAIEQAHAEAFAQLTLEQRRRLLDELASDMPDAEAKAAQRADDQPGSLARVATRAELRQPGTMERAWNRMGSTGGPGMGFGGLFAGSLLASMAGTVLGTMVAQSFFSNHPETSGLFGGETASGNLADDPWQQADSDLSGGDSDFDGGGFDV